MKFFEMFGGAPKVETEEKRTDGAGHIAVPERGISDLDVHMGANDEVNTTNEIARLAQIVEDHHNGKDIGNIDINFIIGKLDNLKADQENSVQS